jgi:hypothetical protein
MSKLLSALIAAGFVFGVSGAIAQNVKSDSDKQRTQDKMMEQKEQGTDQSTQGQRNRPTTDDGRSSQSGAGSDNTSAGQGQTGGGQAGAKTQIPEQSQQSVGHPKEGETTGQGKGVKKQGGEAGQSNSTPGSTTGQTGSDTNQSQGSNPRRNQQ